MNKNLCGYSTQGVYVCEHFTNSSNPIGNIAGVWNNQAVIFATGKGVWIGSEYGKKGFIVKPKGEGTYTFYFLDSNFTGTVTFKDNKLYHEYNGTIWDNFINHICC